MSPPDVFTGPDLSMRCLGSTSRVHDDHYGLAEPAACEESALLWLPRDVQGIILLMLGPAELCALEATCWSLSVLIDDRVWRNAFFQSRRANVLHEPACYKKELMRRDVWSKDWRKLTGCGSPAKVRIAQKLKKIMSLGTMPRKYETLVVDQSGCAEGGFTTIGAALLKAKAFDTVLVRPGEYRECLKLVEHVEIVGAGPDGAVVLCGSEGPVVEAAGVNCRLANLVISQQARGADSAMSSAVLVKSGASLVIEESSISSAVGHCIVIQGAGSCGHVLHNEVANGRGVGVLVCEQARGVVEDNDIACCGRAGVAILSGGDPLVTLNRIRDGLDSGVLVSEQGKGVVEDNDICRNQRAGVAILKEGAPLVQRNRIHGGRDSGVLVCEHGQGSVLDNQIFANAMAGVAIGRGGATKITGNTIRDGSGGSLCLSQNSKGVISGNVIYQPSAAAMQVPGDLIVSVREMNEIRLEEGEAHAEGPDAPYGC